MKIDLRFIDFGDARFRAASLGGRHYVYVLADFNDRPFYVGKGFGNRVFQHEAEARNTIRKSHKLNVIRKLQRQNLPLRYAIIDSLDCEVDCFEIERQLINRLGRHDLGRGPLTNQTDGGEGTSNPSIESQNRRLASLGGEADDPERRTINEFFSQIGGSQDSVPVKPFASWKRAEPLRASVKAIGPTARMAKAIVASAIANQLILSEGVMIPRLLCINDTEYLIENGCGREMIKAGVIGLPQPEALPRDETMPLTRRGFSHVRMVLSDRRLVDLGVLDPEF